MNEVTVLMTTYNENKDILLQAIESIQNQTLKNFNFLIIIDNPKNLEIIKEVKKKAKEDKRIKYIINTKNLGLAKTLNIGIDNIETKYIARMDADDISSKDRLKIQLNYLKKNKNIDLIGCNITYINQVGEKLYNRRKMLTNPEKIKKVMKYANIINHPTFFGKTEVFKNLKYRNLKYSQDYDFMCRALEGNYKLGYINKYLLLYRIQDNISDDKRLYQDIAHYNIQKLYGKENLTDTNIVNIINKELKIIDKNKIVRACIYFDKALTNIKLKKYISGIGLLIKSTILSKYHRKRSVNLLKYLFVKSIK